MTNNTTAELEATVRAGGDVSTAELLAAQAADRLAELRLEGEAVANRDARAVARKVEIDAILDAVAVANADPRLAELQTILVSLLGELIERAAIRSTAIVDATNHLRALDAIGGRSRSAEAWTGQLIDTRNQAAPVNYLTSSPLDCVIGVLQCLPQDIRVGLRQAF
jgi:hypothetical protein